MTPAVATTAPSGAPAAVEAAPPTQRSADSELVFQQAHRGYVTRLDISGDGTTAVAISTDGVASVIDTATGELRASWRVWVRGADQLDVEFADRANRLLISGYSRAGAEFYVWDVDDGRWFTHSSLPGRYQGVVALSPDGSRVAWGHWGEVADDDADGQAPASVVVETLGAPTATAKFPMTAGATQLRWSPDGTRLLINDGDQTIGLYDPVAGTPIRILELADTAVAAFSPNGARALLLSLGGGLTVIDTATGEVAASGQLPDGQTATNGGWGGGPERILVATDKDKLLVWDPSAGAQRAFTELIMSDASDGETASRLWSDDGTALFSVSNSGALDRRDPATGALRNQVVPPNDQPLLGGMSPDGSVLGASHGDTLTFWNADGTHRSSSKQGGGEHSVWGVRWLPDSSGLATWGRGGVELWTAAGGAQTTACSGTGRMTFAADGTQRYFVGDDADGYYRMCDPQSGAIAELEGVLAITDDGNRYLRRHGSKLQLVDSSTHKPIVTLKTGEQYFGARILSRWGILFGDKTALFELRSGKRVHVVGEEANIWPSADEQYVAYQGEAKATVVRLSDRKSIATIEGKGNPVVFKFASAGHDYAAAIGIEVSWVIGAERHAVQTPGRVIDLIYSKDGSRLIAHLLGGQRAIYELATEQLVATVGGPDDVIALPKRHAWSHSADAVANCTPAGPVLTRLADAPPEPLAQLPMCGDLTVSPDGALLAVQHGTQVTVIRLADRATLTMRTLRLDGEAGRVSFPLAYDSQGHFTTIPEALPYLRLRAAGPITAAPLSPITEIPAADADLVQRFFRGESIATAAAAPAQPTEN